MLMMRNSSILALITLHVSNTAVMGSQLHLEIQSKCLKPGDLDNAIGEHIFPGLQRLAVPITSISRETVSVPSFKDYTTSSGGDRKLKMNGPKHNALRRLPKLDCPVVKDCPCNGCPGHWCMIFCGYKQSRSLQEAVDQFAQQVVGRPVLQEEGRAPHPTAGSDHEESYTLRRRPLANLNRDLFDQEAFVCRELQVLLSEPAVQDTCLRDAEVVSCSLS